MKDKLISYQTAKLAKKKGFYSTEEDYYKLKKVDNIIYDFYNDGKLTKVTMPRVAMSMEKDRPEIDTVYILAPTQSLLQKWLREIHEIHIYSEISETGYLWFIKFDHNRCRIMNSTKIFNSYERALEIGLQKALKLIKETES